MAKERDHIAIRERIIEASYTAIAHLQGILEEPLLRADFDVDGDLGPEKFLNALKSKKQAQTDAFEMLAKIEEAQNFIASLTKEASEKEKKVQESSKGFAETRARK